MVEGTGMGGGAEAGFREAFFEGVGLIAMDLDRLLRCLSQNLALKLEAISSSSSSSSQIIGGTTRSTPACGPSLKEKENEEDEEDETDGEDGDVGGRVFTLWTRRATISFFF